MLNLWQAARVAGVRLAKLDVPKKHLEPLRAFLGLSPAQRAAFVAALEGAKASIDLAGLSSDLPTAGAAPVQIVGVFASLYLGRDRSGIEQEQYSSDVVDALKRAEIPLNGDDWVGLKRDLTRILGAHDTLGLTAKSFELLEEHERVFCSSRIMTDLRPIFTLKEDEKVRGAVITHTLRVSFHDNDPSHPRDFVVGMRTSDLHRLKAVVERAIEKERVLRAELGEAISLLGDVDA